MATDRQKVKTTYTIDFGRGGPSAPVTGMTPDEQRGHAAALMAAELPHSLPQARPTAVLTGGQPGSGKSRIVDEARERLRTQGGAVVIDPDEIRPTLPYMKERIARGDLDIPNEANVDAGTIAYQMVQIAKQERRNVVIDGTLQNTKRALDLAGEMRSAGYDVQFHGMAVYPDLSHARTYSRREEQIAASPTGFGRGVSDEFHDQAVEGYRNTVDAFQRKSAVDSMTFYGADGKKIETRFSNGSWVPAISMSQEIEMAQKRPDLQTMMAATDAWWTAARAMRTRGAAEGEIGKVEAFGRYAALQERQLRATTVKAHIDFTRHDLRLETTRDEEPAEIRHDLSNESLRSLAALVHSGIAHAGRDADRSLMTVSWDEGEAYLDVRTHKERGYERLILPQHERIERAISGIAKDGSLEVDYATETARVRGLDPRTLDAKARALGLEAKDFGVEVGQAEPTQERTSMKTSTLAAMMASRSHHR